MDKILPCLITCGQ